MDMISALRSGRPLSVEQAFEAGDYMFAALQGSTSQWQYHAAYGMIVDPLAGAAALAAFEEPEAQFFRAACAWIGGDEAFACQLLEGLESDHARNLLALLRQEQIEVLAQLPAERRGIFVIRDGIAADRKFVVHNIGTYQGDLSPDPATGRIMGSYAGARPPSFFLCAFVEHQDIPFDIADLPCPTIGCATDFDATIPTAAPWLRMFDHTITCDSTVQWEAMRRLTGRPSYSFPHFYGAPRDLPPPGTGVRDIDVFMSGSLFMVREPDKARFAINVAEASAEKAVLIDGGLPSSEYYKILARTRVSPCFCRFPTAILTRAIEALSMGSVALVPEGNVMLLWGGKKEGIVTYDQAVGPGPQIAEVLNDYPEYGANCLANAGRIREAFKAETVASRLFRFATVVAARPAGNRDRAAPAHLSHRRSSFIRGWGDPGTPYDADVALAAAGRLAQSDKTAPAAHWHNEAARELMLAYGLTNFRRLQPPKLDILLRPALDILRNAVRIYPNNLVLRFNLMRILFRFGNEVERTTGLVLAQEIVDRPEGEWQIDALDDLYPFDFNGGAVNTCDFCEREILQLAGADDQRTQLCNLVLASVFHLLAVHWGRIDCAMRAAALDPDFAYYGLTLAELLIRDGSGEKGETARRLLEKLAHRSELTGRAEALLASLPQRQGSRNLVPLERNLILSSDHRELFGSAFALSGWFRRGGARGAVVHKHRAGQEAPLVSIVICGQAAFGLAPVLAALQAHTAGRRRHEIVYVDCYGEPAPEVMSEADVVLSCGQNGVLPFPLVALNDALGLATAPVALVLDSTATVDSDVLASLEATFYDGHASAPRSRLVTGPVGAEGGPGFIAFRIDDAARLGYFDEHHLFAGDRAITFELAWRLSVSGVPSLGMDGDRSVEKPLTPWWRMKPFCDRPLLLEIATALSPPLLDESRTEALFPRMERYAPSEAGDAAAPASRNTAPVRHELANLRLGVYQALRKIASGADIAAWSLAWIPAGKSGVDRTAAPALTDLLPVRRKLVGPRLLVYQVLRQVAYCAETAAWRLVCQGRTCAALILFGVMLVKPLMAAVVPASLYTSLASWFRRHFVRR